MEQWLIENWKWILAGFYIMEKVVYLTPTKYDDIAISILKGSVSIIANKNKK